MSDQSSVWHWLESAGLERFYERFREHGINEENFCNLAFQDYDAVGITEHQDRQTLFKLIQVVKKELQNPSSYGGDDYDSPQQQHHQQQQQHHHSSSKKHRPTSSDRRGKRPSKLQKPSRIKAPGSSGIPRPTTPSRIPRSGGYADHSPDVSPQPSPMSGGGAYDDSAASASSAASGSSSSQQQQSSGVSAARALKRPPLKDVDQKIRVIVRKRPLNRREKMKGDKDCVEASVADVQTVHVHEPKVKVDLTKYIEKHKFIFDEVFGEDADNSIIYERTAQPLVSFFLSGGKCTCFAYGQTGSGKTHTMMGPGGGRGAQQGLYVLAARDIFKRLRNHPGAEVWVSFFEIYGGKLFDLLNNRKKLACREDSNRRVNIVGITEKQVRGAEELLEVTSDGNKSRSTGKTGANADSSRSHAVLQIALKSIANRNSGRRKMIGKFSFIDLAGSERGADTSTSDRRTRLEGAEINKSLLALKECIRALDQDARHRPFRGSKLTQVLKDSFIGNSRTIMIANVSPNVTSVEHTLNTLRYADRVKELRKTSASSRKAQYNAYMPHRAPDDVEIIDPNEDSGTDEEFLVDMNGDIDDLDLLDDAGDLSPSYQEQQDERQRVKGGNRGGSSGGNKGTNSASSRGGGGGGGGSKSGNSRGGSSNKKPSYQQSTLYQDELREFDADEHSVDHKDEDDLLRHQLICAAILEEEDEIVEAHRRQIDDTMKLVKSEMELLKQFDQLGYSVDDYVGQLDAILASKIASIKDLRDRIAMFKDHLKEEEILSTSLKQRDQHHQAGKRRR
eukprot:TRINITY_DN66494_c9_g9_i1.p1 TRINITY_DN66494_c9_g9~~TRINITY_DN66494_c9_g9_i1.p1  ORF type:complete len:822 (+),score=447.92 TRINITY_DN66494_c9_g9_i1:98-2467(+)